MKMKKAAPEEGPKKTRDHFHHWKGIAGGEKHHAFLAGEVHWIVGHPSDKGSKPCLLWATDNALPCRFCAMGLEPCQLGYVPVYRATDYKTLFVIVYKEEREWMEQLEVHDRIVIGREKGLGARLFVRKSPVQEPEFSTTIDYRKCAQSIEDDLLVTWGLPELTAYLRCAPSDNAVSQTPTKEPPVKSNGEPFGAMHESAAKKYGGHDPDADTAGVDAARNRLLAMQAQVQRNGKHKPPPKG